MKRFIPTKGKEVETGSSGTKVRKTTRIPAPADPLDLVLRKYSHIIFTPATYASMPAIADGYGFYPTTAFMEEAILYRDMEDAGSAGLPEQLAKTGAALVEAIVRAKAEGASYGFDKEGLLEARTEARRALSALGEIELTAGGVRPTRDMLDAYIEAAEKLPSYQVQPKDRAGLEKAGLDFDWDNVHRRYMDVMVEVTKKAGVPSALQQAVAARPKKLDASKKGEIKLGA